MFSKGLPSVEGHRSWEHVYEGDLGAVPFLLPLPAAVVCTPLLSHIRLHEIHPQFNRDPSMC